MARVITLVLVLVLVLQHSNENRSNLPQRFMAMISAKLRRYVSSMVSYNIRIVDGSGAARLWPGASNIATRVDRLDRTQKERSF